MPDRTLDILVPTIEERDVAFRAMVWELRRQIRSLSLERTVGVLWERDAGEVTVGHKRNELVQRAEAAYVVFIDDDDVIDRSYLKHVILKIGNRDIDCVGMWQQWRLANGMWQDVKISIEYKRKQTLGAPGLGWSEYHVPAQHTCAIRREIMDAFPFPDIGQGEDEQQGIAMADAGALRYERMVDYPLYWYIPGWQKRTHGLRYDMSISGIGTWEHDLDSRERSFDQITRS